MEVKLVKKDIFSLASDVTYLGVFENEKNEELKKADRLLEGLLFEVMKQENFKGKEGELISINSNKKLKAKRLVVVGLGDKKLFNLEKARSVSAKVTKLVKKNSTSISTNLFDKFENREKYAQALVEGFYLASYSFKKFKTKDKEKDKINTLFLTSDGKDVEKAAINGKLVSEATLLARDISNNPANFATPTEISRIAKELARKNNFSCTVFDKKRIEKEKMGGLLGVSYGSFQEPKFLVLDYKGKNNSPVIVLVGKGITFDSGGISLKPSKEMDKMKFDKCGAIAVLSVFTILSKLKLPFRVVGLLPFTENLPGGKATKPGDILKISNGKTVEVLNTDAEGRLILADALSYSRKYKPDVVIDLATLTGACVVALGDVAAGLMTNSEKLAERLIKAGNETGERVWRMPLFDEYSKDVESNIADVKNLGSEHKAGAGTAAAFLKEFVECKEWAHLDIAGVAWATSIPIYFPDYITNGATGYGVRLLAKFLLEYK